MEATMPHKQKIPETDVCYIWNGSHEQLAELVHQLKKRGFVKRKKDLFDLFANPYEGLQVKWDKKRKSHLAYLLHRLFTNGYCCIRGSKGYFAHAEKHLVDIEGNGFSKSTLRKLSSKINKNQKAYQDVIAEVEGILEYL